jgi:hypothetical protein
MAYTLIEKDHDSLLDNAWNGVFDESGNELVFASLDELRSWVSVNREFPDSVRIVEVPEDY